MPIGVGSRVTYCDPIHGDCVATVLGNSAGLLNLLVQFPNGTFAHKSSIVGSATPGPNQYDNATFPMVQAGLDTLPPPELDGTLATVEVSGTSIGTPTATLDVAAERLLIAFAMGNSFSPVIFPGTVSGGGLDWQRVQSAYTVDDWNGLEVWVAYTADAITGLDVVYTPPDTVSYLSGGFVLAVQAVKNVVDGSVSPLDCIGVSDAIDDDFGQLGLTLSGTTANSLLIGGFECALKSDDSFSLLPDNELLYSWLPGSSTKIGISYVSPGGGGDVGVGLDQLNIYSNVAAIEVIPTS